MNLTGEKIRNLFCLAALICAVLFSSGRIFAQETRGTIRGTISDPNKAAVSGVTVTVLDVARGTTTSLTTNDQGLFQANYLFPSTYRITVEANGFKKVVRENVILQIGQKLDVDIDLEIGGGNEVVTVNNDAPPLETATASISQTIDSKRLAELPLVHGDPYTLVGLSPGATYTGSARLDRPFEPTHIIGYAIDGTRGNRSDLTIDGAPSTATANANEVIATYVPPSDIVQEFKVQTATFDAQFGNTEGGVTSISIKSGTNKLHGSAYYFAEPGNLAANDFFGNARGQARPETKSNRFGGYVSGPVRIPYLFNGKDKTFFLFGYEGIRDSRPRFDATNIFVPTAAMRAGDFSAFTAANCVPPVCTTPVTIYDPQTRVNTGSVSSPVYTGTAFAGNVIPDSRINPIAKAILNYYALPKTSGLTGNINDSTLAEKTQPYDNYTFRVDQNITNNNHLFVRGSLYNRNSFYNDYLSSDATGVNFIFKSRQGVIDDVHTFNSTTFLNVKYGYNHFVRQTDQEGGAVGFDLTQLGFASSYNGLLPAADRRFPRFDFNGASGAPTVLGTAYGNEYRPVDTNSFSTTLNKIIGNHSAKIGGELRIYRENDFFTSNDQTGQFSFGNDYTRQASNGSADTTGVQAFAAFLLGLPTTQQIVRRADYSEYSKTYGFFVQDDWKFSRKLSLNLGLRYEVETPLTERQNKSVTGFDPTYVQPSEAAVRAKLTSNPVIGYNGATIDPNSINLRGGLLFADKDSNGKLYNTPKNTFLPRFGAAYQWNSKTVIRGGVGLFAGFLGERRGDVIQSGYTRTTTLGTTNLASGAPIPQSISLFPSSINVLEPVGSAQGKQTGLGGAISFFNQNPKISKQLRSQIGIQRELMGGFVFEAEYVNNYGYNIEISRNINALPDVYLNGDNFRSAAQSANDTNLRTGVANPFFGLSDYAGTSFATGTTIARSQFLRPFPNFGDITTTNNDGKSWYNSGQFSLQKRFSQGYTIQASYTFSKWIQQTEYLNAGDETPTKMIADQDSPHRFSLSSLVTLPFGKGKFFLSNANGLVDRLINGWQFGGVYTYQTGFPIAFSTDVFYNGGRINLGVNKPTTARFFNTDVFTTILNSSATAATPVNHLRTLPTRFSQVRRDSINNVDFSLLKDFRVKEEMKFQFRFELINALNNPYLPVPAVSPATTSFGQILSTVSNQDNYARRVQVGFKFLF